jgi:hypothetical protein
VTVLAFDPERRTNAQAIADCVTLGYLRVADRVLDATYGLGRFWTTFRPPYLAMNDIDPERGNMHYDFTSLPFDARSWDTVVFDPPYKLNGTPSGGGPASSDVDYGVERYTRWQDRHALIREGIVECARVADRTLLIKCQDQVSSGKVRWQTMTFTEQAISCGFELVDELHVYGYRAQPPGRRQVHAARNVSTLLVLERLGR